MEDIIEKLRLLDYENTFCKKYNKEIIHKLYFACNNCYKPPSPNSMKNANMENTSKTTQFAYFYELSNWLIALIKQVL